MSSKVPRDNDAVFIAGIDNLITIVEVIDVNVNPNEDYPVIPEVMSFDNYKKWLDEVREHFKTDDLKQYLDVHHDFFFAERLQPPMSSLSTSIISSRLPKVEPREFRVKLHNAIISQIKALRSIKDAYQKRSNPTVIHIEHDGTVWRDDRDKYLHKSTHGRTKRIRMLKHIANKKSHVSAAELMKKLDYAQISTLSREKGELNEKLRKHLEIQQDVVLGGDHTRNKGYMINPAFIVKIEPKRS